MKKYLFLFVILQVTSVIAGPGFQYHEQRQARELNLSVPITENINLIYPNQYSRRLVTGFKNFENYILNDIRNGTCLSQEIESRKGKSQFNDFDCVFYSPGRGFFGYSSWSYVIKVKRDEAGQFRLSSIEKINYTADTIKAVYQSITSSIRPDNTPTPSYFSPTEISQRQREELRRRTGEN